MKRVAAIVLGIFATFPAVGAAESWVRVVNLDGSHEGLNDPSAWTPAGGNPATTLGEARLRAVEMALAMWANALSSDVSIVAGVAFDPLGGTTSSAVLAFGGTDSVYRDFAGAPQSGTWYVSALADMLAGLDLDDGASPLDLTLTFNSDIDGAALGATSFYYGFDGATPPSDVELLSVAAHEIAHGLGFATFVNKSTGAKALGFDDAYMRHLEHHGAAPSDFPSMTDSQRQQATVAGESLHWVGLATTAAASGLSAGVGGGGHLQMYGPAPLTANSLNHLDVGVAPDELMEPFYLGAALDLRLTATVLQDVGWNAPPVCSEVTIP